jgi:hypothetical protein
MYAGLSVLQRPAASGQLRPVVIVALGTNGGVTTQQVHQLMAIVGGKRKVVPWAPTIGKERGAPVRVRLVSARRS